MVTHSHTHTHSHRDVFAERLEHVNVGYVKGKPLEKRFRIARKEPAEKDVDGFVAHTKNWSISPSATNGKY